MTTPLMPKATAVWLVENTTLTFKQIGDFCELHELEIQAIADGDVAFNIVGLNPITGGQLTAEEIKRCEQDEHASLQALEPEHNVKIQNLKAKKMLSPSQRSDKPAAILWILRHCPEIIDSQICKLIGTTKKTIEGLRNGTHREMEGLRPKNPVAIGLCKEKDLDEAIAVSQRWLEQKSKPKNIKSKVAKKAADKEKAAAKKAAKKAADKEKAAAKKAAKKAADKEKAAAKKAAKKAADKEKAAAKKAAKKAADKEKAAAKKAAKKAADKEKAAAKKAAKKAADKEKAAAKKAAKKAADKERAAAKKAAKKAAAKKTVKKKTAVVEK